jgi:hypothetical protein
MCGTPGCSRSSGVPYCLLAHYILALVQAKPKIFRRSWRANAFRVVTKKDIPARPSGPDGMAKALEVKAFTETD